MFEVHCMRTDKTHILDKTLVLIILRQFDDGYEKFFEILSMDQGETKWITKDSASCSDSLYMITRVN